MFFSLGGTFLLALCFTVVVHYRHKQNLSDELQRRGGILSTGIAMSSQKAMLTSDTSRIKFIVDLYSRVDPDIVYVVIVNARGEIVYHTFDGGFPADLAPLLHEHSRKSILLETEDGFVRNIPTPIFGGRAGVSHLGLSEQRIRAQVLRNQAVTIYIVLFITFAGVAVLTLLSRSVTSPINEVITAAGKFGAGDYSMRLPVRSNDETGQLARAFNAMADELQLHHREIVQTEKLAAIGRLSSAVAHEINNPLMGVQNACRIIKSDSGLNPKSLEYLELIEESLGKMERIVRGLLLTSRERDSGKRDFAMEQAAAKAVALARHAADRKRIAIRENMPESGCVVHGAPERFEQVVLNLLLNAVDAAPAGSVINVSASCGHGTEFAILHVEDQGPGIPAPVLEHIFEPFYTTKEPGVGTGLGLYVCYEIVSEMQGRIEVATGPEQGTAFHVYIPLARERTPSADDGHGHIAG
jgi:signal transduction histidine kinase